MADFGDRFVLVTTGFARNALTLVVVCALVLVAGAQPAQAAPGDPQLDWASAVGGTGDEEGAGVAVDAAGNTHITGTFEGTVDFDPGTGVTDLTSNGGGDVFVAVYDPTGNLIHAKGIGGTGFDQGRGVAVDAAGNTHITGSFSGTVDFDPNGGVTSLTSNGSGDIFVAVYDATGNLIHAQGIGGTNDDQGRGVAVDTAGNTHITGLFRNNVDFDPGAGVTSLTSNGSGDIFVAVYDPTGNLIHALNIGSTRFEEGDGVAVDTAGNTHITGIFGGTIDFDPSAGVTNLTSNSASGIFVAVYDPTGNLTRAHAIGDSDSDQGTGVAVDTAGNTHITGNFQGTVDFDPGAGVTSLTSNGSGDIFVAVYDPTGNLTRALNIGGTFFDTGSGVAVDTAGNTHITGWFEGTVDFDPSAGMTNHTSNGNADIFVAVYDPTGNLIRAHTTGGTSSDEGRGIAVDTAGNTHITGDFRGTVDFDPSPGVSNLVSVGSDDIFVARYSTQAASNQAPAAVDDAASTGFETALAVNVINGSAGGADTDPDGDTLSVTAITGFTNGTATFTGDTITYTPNTGFVGTDTGTYTIDDGNGLIDTASLTITVAAASNQAPAAVDDAAATGFETALAVNVIDGSAGGADTDPDGDTLSVTAITGFTNGTATFTGDTITYTPNTGFVGTDTGTYTIDDGNGLIDTASLTITTAAAPASCANLTVTIDLNINPGATATAGDDVILGTPGNDTIDGLGGDDTICGEGGDDTITGGDGLDFIFGGDGNDTMSGGDGNDRIRGNQGIDIINGEAGNDFLFGGIDGDTISGGDGNDFIGGFGGDDTINAGAGRDRVFGGFGADIINAGPGNDTINGLIGNDIINGGPGNDILNGDQGRDTINGNNGNDTVNGGNSLDSLFGNDGDDTVSGGKANDTLNGGDGIDTCAGNRGVDVADASCETLFGIP